MRNRRLQFALMRRQPMPAIVPFLIDSIDRCDPTRSRESKPSERMREARYTRRVLRSFLSALLAFAGLLVWLSSRFN